jgi:hypothetical protein
VLMIAAICGSVQAQSLAPRGCPISHCTPAATGVISQALTDNVLVTNANSALGSLHAEGCSGNGARLMCLFLKDKAPASRKGTLKALDATTLKALWGSAAAANSYDLDANTAAMGQVPVIFSNGLATAGDASVQVLYNSAGTAIRQLQLSGGGTNFGLTPLTSPYGVVSQGNGVLTLVDTSSWQNVGSLVLRNPLTQDPVNLVGPSAGFADTLYAVGYNDADGTGVLFSVTIDSDTPHMKVRSMFNFTGQSGATPVAVSPGVSGLTGTLVLLHVPGLPGDGTPQNRLLGLVDSAAGLSQRWEMALPAPLAVSPTVDAGSQSLFYESGPYIRQVSLNSGVLLQIFDLAQIGGFPASFRLNGHLVSSSADGVFTLLLGGGATVPKRAAGQFVMAFQPMVAPTTLLWKQKIADQLATYNGAWNFSAASQAGALCPIAIAITEFQSTITRLCDH